MTKSKQEAGNLLKRVRRLGLNIGIIIIILSAAEHCRYQRLLPIKAACPAGLGGWDDEWLVDASTQFSCLLWETRMSLNASCWLLLRGGTNRGGVQIRVVLVIYKWIQIWSIHMLLWLSYKLEYMKIATEQPSSGTLCPFGQGYQMDSCLAISRTIKYFYHLQQY